MATSAEPEPTRRAYRVRGRVQGVGYRWWTRKTAAALGLRGTVRNLSDGSVAVEASGNVAALGELEAELGRGPSTASVDAVEREEPGRDNLPAGFEIIR